MNPTKLPHIDNMLTLSNALDDVVSFAIFQFLPFCDKLRFRLTNAQVHSTSKQVPQLIAIKDFYTFLNTHSVAQHSFVLSHLSSRLAAILIYRPKSHPLQVCKLTAGVVPHSRIPYIIAEFILTTDDVSTKFTVHTNQQTVILPPCDTHTYREVQSAFSKEYAALDSVFKTVSFGIHGAFGFRYKAIDAPISKQCQEIENSSEEFLERYDAYWKDPEFVNGILNNIAVLKNNRGFKTIPETY